MTRTRTDFLKDTNTKMPAQHVFRPLMKANVVLPVVAMLAVIPLLSPLAQGTAGRALRNGLFDRKRRERPSLLSRFEAAVHSWLPSLTGENDVRVLVTGGA